MWPDANQAELVTVLEPVRHLLDRRLFEVIGQGGLAGGGRCTGQNIAAGVDDSGSAECRVQSGEWGRQRDDALAAEQIFDVGLLSPTGGFVWFGFEFRDGLDWVTGGA